VSTFDQLVYDVLQSLQGYGLAQPRMSHLSGSITDTATSITVVDATGFEQGVCEIDNETIFIESVDYDSNILTVSPDGRGYYGTTAAAHSANARVTMAPTWGRGRVANAINEAITNTFPDLFKVATTTVVFSPVQTTYALPATVEQVLRVTTDTIGPSNETPLIVRHSFDPVAKTLTIEKGGFPGKNFNVTYSTAPTQITFGDDFTESGLRETAKLAIKYAACSQLLAFMDPARLPVDTAQADELDASRNQIGSASKISTQLYQRYLIELENERKRLRATTPTPISVRTR
jgi:hypothetical protein